MRVLARNVSREEIFSNLLNSIFGAPWIGRLTRYIPHSQWWKFDSLSNALTVSTHIASFISPGRCKNRKGRLKKYLLPPANEVAGSGLSTPVCQSICSHLGGGAMILPPVLDSTPPPRTAPLPQDGTPPRMTPSTYSQQADGTHPK